MHRLAWGASDELHRANDDLWPPRWTASEHPTTPCSKQPCTAAQAHVYRRSASVALIARRRDRDVVDDATLRRSSQAGKAVKTRFAPRRIARNVVS